MQLWRLLWKTCLGVFNSRSRSDSLAGERLAAFALVFLYKYPERRTLEKQPVSPLPATITTHGAGRSKD